MLSKQELVYSSPSMTRISLLPKRNEELKFFDWAPIKTVGFSPAWVRIQPSRDVVVDLP